MMKQARSSLLWSIIGTGSHEGIDMPWSSSLEEDLEGRQNGKEFNEEDAENADPLQVSFSWFDVLIFVAAATVSRIGGSVPENIAGCSALPD